MRRGFTLLEVVVALLVLEVGVVGVVGALVLASSTLARAEALELQVAVTEGVLDSLARRASRGADSIRTPAGVVSWTIDDSARMELRATDLRGDTVLDLRSALPPW
jgi:type II secretory pathway pseudopilin PulG